MGDIAELIKSGKIKCPRKYGSYDQRGDRCPVCGNAKLYQIDHYTMEGSACSGWADEVYGPVSCTSYVKISETAWKP